ncbi:hypothetical protein BGW41_001524 [Actinomortierella wolfii]|nr:hypothetical protein BGW41_001524 [Actinomortierella wolfii]
MKIQVTTLALATLFLANTVSATWCWMNGSDRCSRENVHGEATAGCCDRLGIKNRNRGCWVTGDDWRKFANCCVEVYGCDTVRD